MKMFLAAVLALSGCAAPAGNAIDATIRNDTPIPFVVKVSTPWGQTSVVIAPGTTWSGQVDRRMIPSRVSLVVELPSAQK